MQHRLLPVMAGGETISYALFMESTIVTDGLCREVRRTRVALSPGFEAARRAPGRSIPSRTRAIVQIALTAILLPLCLYVLFVAETTSAAARQSAGAVLGAIVTFWLKD